MSSAQIVTYKHIRRVNELLCMAAAELIRRGSVHDASKFSPEELIPLERLQAVVNKEGQAPYGSKEYERRKQFLEPMLQHHYANNTHHPEHYESGIAGMDLFDLIEMFFDWKAASERGEESAMGLSVSVGKYNISPQLYDILKNTADRLGYAVK